MILAVCLSIPAKNVIQRYFNSITYPMYCKRSISINRQWRYLKIWTLSKIHSNADHGTLWLNCAELRWLLSNVFGSCVTTCRFLWTLHDSVLPRSRLRVHFSAQEADRWVGQPRLERMVCIWCGTDRPFDHFLIYCYRYSRLLLQIFINFPSITMAIVYIPSISLWIPVFLFTSYACYHLW